MRARALVCVCVPLPGRCSGRQTPLWLRDDDGGGGGVFAGDCVAKLEAAEIIRPAAAAAPHRLAANVITCTFLPVERVRVINVTLLKIIVDRHRIAAPLAWSNTGGWEGGSGRLSIVPLGDLRKNRLFID